jgi:hypothetical protein
MAAVEVVAAAAVAGEGAVEGEGVALKVVGLRRMEEIGQRVGVAAVAADAVAEAVRVEAAALEIPAPRIYAACNGPERRRESTPLSSPPLVIPTAAGNRGN